MNGLGVKQYALGLALVLGPESGTHAASAQPARAVGGIDAASVLRDRIVATFGRGRDPHLKSAAKSVGEVRDLVRDRVDGRLLAGAIVATGRDYQFTASDGSTRYVGLLALRYSTNAMAAQRARLLAGPNRHFANTEVMTPMIVTASGGCVFVLFTESAGDPAVLSVLASTAARLPR